MHAHASFLYIDPYTPPENITIIVSTPSTDPTALLMLNFTWSPVTTGTSCLVQYQIHTTNCGMCSSIITNLTTVTCEVADLPLEGQLCTIVLLTVINGENVSEASSPFSVMLKGW